MTAPPLCTFCASCLLQFLCSCRNFISAHKALSALLILNFTALIECASCVIIAPTAWSAFTTLVLYTRPSSSVTMLPTSSSKLHVISSICSSFQSKPLFLSSFVASSIICLMSSFWSRKQVTVVSTDHVIDPMPFFLSFTDFEIYFCSSFHFSCRGLKTPLIIMLNSDRLSFPPCLIDKYSAFCCFLESYVVFLSNLLLHDCRHQTWSDIHVLHHLAQIFRRYTVKRLLHIHRADHHFQFSTPSCAVAAIERIAVATSVALLPSSNPKVWTFSYSLFFLTVLLI